jgi:hypothetical protein
LYKDVEEQTYFAISLYLQSRAERERFELSVATSTTTVFETAPFNHSGTSPKTKFCCC